MRIHQVAPWNEWPSGDSKPIAVLPGEPAELSARFGLLFDRRVDDLGPYRLAAVDLHNGTQAWISRHDDDPNPGSVVFVDASLDVKRALTRLAKLFGLSPQQLL